MTIRLRQVQPFLAALVLGLLLCIGSVSAQQQSGANPTQNAVTEEQLFQELDKLSGRVTIPYKHAGILEQPQGRQYRGFREGALPWIGGVAIIGMILLLTAFYVYRGRIRLRHDEDSGRKILRFNAFERFTHWLTATSFILLALSGLNYIFGKRLIMPLVGPEAFATWSQWAKYTHNFMAWPFMLGLIAMFVLWIRDNIPDRYDAAWLKAGGGFIGDKEPDAARFNAGQKIVFWAVILGGLGLSVSGLTLLFPLALVDVNGMQIAQYIHAVIGVLLIAVIIAHIYIGSLGMEGAYSAMGSGEVDLSWARHHHRAWVEERQAKTASGKQVGRGSPSVAE